MSFCVRSIRIFTKFSSDPYYEPLSWFMIYIYICYMLYVVHLNQLKCVNIPVVNRKFLPLNPIDTCNYVYRHSPCHNAYNRNKHYVCYGNTYAVLQ